MPRAVKGRADVSSSDSADSPPLKLRNDSVSADSRGHSGALARARTGTDQEVRSRD